MKKIALSLTLLLCSLQAATIIYLPAVGPHEAFISGCTTATPTVCTVDDATGLTVIDPTTGTNTVLSVSGIAATGVTNHMADPRGLLKIKAISGNNITLMTMAGADQPFTGTWESGALGGEIAGPQRLRRVIPFTMCDGPKGAFDCWNGPITRSWATGTHNGLTSLTVTSNVATATFSYDLSVVRAATGNKISVWGTMSSTLSGTNGSEFTMTVTGTNTLTFPVTLANGTYTTNNVCGPTPGSENTIGGTSNCVRLSFRATSTNVFWATIQGATSSPATIPYQGTGANWSQYAVFCAYRVFVDQKAQAHLNYALLHLTQTEQYGGNNFPVNTAVQDGGNYFLSAQVSGQSMYLARAFSLVGEFLTSAQLTKFKAQMLNDLQDQSSCTLSTPSPIAVTTGTATAGDATHITLAAGASGTNDFYKDNIAEHVTGGQHSAGVITAYNGTTKQATVTGWDNGSPGNGSTYSVWESFTAASGATLSNVVLTGKNTHWLSEVSVGDYIFGLVRWNGFLNPQELGGLIGTVTDDTHITVFANSTNGVSTTPVAGWITHPWQTGDCGLQAVQNFWNGALGSQPVQYPPRGGNAWKVLDNIGGDLAGFEIPKFLSLIDVDSRAVTNLAKISIMGLDENLDLALNYFGNTFSGSNYGPGRAQDGQYSIASALNTVPGFPSLDLTGGFVSTFQYWKQFAAYPDIRGYPRFGDSAGQRPRPQDLAMDWGGAFDPTTTASKYTNYFLRNVLQLTTSGSVNSTNLADFALRLDPNAATADYKTQPLQIALIASSRAASLGLGGRSYPPTYLGGSIVSKNSWTDSCATHWWINSMSLGLDHQGRVQPDKQLWKCGMFLDNDDLPPGNGVSNGSWVEFDGADHFKANDPLNDPALVNITRYSGTLPYGDPNSQYMCGVRNDAGAYTITQTRNNFSFCHFKPISGLTDDIMITFRDVATPGSHVIRDQDYFTQNSQNLYQNTYSEGATTYPGSGGCGALNTNRTVLSQQDGTTSAPIVGAIGDELLPGVSAPAHVYNMVAKYLAPGTINVNCDGTSFSGAQGNAERVSIYGSGSVGGTSTSLQFFAAYSILAQPATTVSAALLSSGSGWGVAQISSSVMAHPTDGTDHSSAAFTTTYSGTGQVVVMGLIPGTYAVKIAGTPIAGSPLSVPANDNSLHFFGAAGAVTVDLQGVATGGTPVYGSTIVRGK